MKGNHENCLRHEADLAEVTRQREALADALAVVLGCLVYGLCDDCRKRAHEALAAAGRR